MSSMITNNSLGLVFKHIQFIVVIAIISFVVFSGASPINASVRTIEKPDVRVSANIGDGILEIFGYGPPMATIVLEGRSVYEETHTNENGYFVFKNARIRISAQEVCLRALANGSASSQPVCLSIPAQKYVRVGPIILPPIITMNKLSYVVQDTAVIQGSTAPNSDVKVKLFSTNIDDNSTTGISLPQINTRSSKDGTFSLSIPNNTDQRLRFYAQTSYHDIDSGKSTTLTIDILPSWLMILRTFGGILSGLKNVAPWMVILGEISFLVWFFFVRKKKKHELMVIENTSLLAEEHPHSNEKRSHTTQNKASAYH